MPKLIVLTPRGDRREIEAARGLSVMEALRDADQLLAGECNGSLACATCHVVVDPAWFAAVGAPGEAEEDMLDTAFNVAATSRLACQIIVDDAMDGLTVRLPG
ncbi:2Fe-2S iron-sulfur cluster-binding protein [Azospirillum sp. ST 5-10]|uniref:2Fe-2S iron-sulfur cluster-binding protein n=1 Tax=unclassified Azospirillum TaxID=2630922 RepID=UPI003F4A4C88